MNTALKVAAPGVLANDTDADGDKLTVGMPSKPRNGNLTMSASGAFTYTPNAGFTGDDKFTYMAHDTHGAMITGNVTVTVGSGGGGGGASLVISNAKVTEGNSGTSTNAVFKITRSSGTGTASVKYATANGTAVAGSDYTAVPSTTVSFAAGETTKSVTVRVTGDNAVELNEKFSVKLSAPAGATIVDAKGVGTILNDD